MNDAQIQNAFLVNQYNKDNKLNLKLPKVLGKKQS